MRDHFIYSHNVSLDNVRILLGENYLSWSLLGLKGLIWQRAKKVVSGSPGLVDFAIGLVNSVINLPDGQMKFFEDFKLQKNFEINLLI